MLPFCSLVQQRKRLLVLQLASLYVPLGTLCIGWRFHLLDAHLLLLLAPPVVHQILLQNKQR